MTTKKKYCLTENELKDFMGQARENCESIVECFRLVAAAEHEKTVETFLTEFDCLKLAEKDDAYFRILVGHALDYLRTGKRPAELASDRCLELTTPETASKPVSSLCSCGGRFSEPVLAETKLLACDNCGNVAGVNFPWR